MWPGRRGQMVSCGINLRVGGRWRYVMTANEGAGSRTRPGGRAVPLPESGRAADARQ